METLSEAMQRLRAVGYDATATATPDGLLRCAECEATHEPSRVRLDEVVRFEGTSDPGDEAILVAFACSCGCRVLYSAAYGPSTPPADAEVLQRLPHR